MNEMNHDMSLLGYIWVWKRLFGSESLVWVELEEFSDQIQSIGRSTR